jgi:hypothetical protein
MKRSPWRYLWKAADIRRKLLITIGILTIYRLAAHVPVPGANRAAIANILAGSGAGGTLVGLLDLLSGGTVSNFSVLAMGVYPYITAQIIIQLLVPIIPALQKRMPKVDGKVDLLPGGADGNVECCRADQPVQPVLAECPGRAEFQPVVGAVPAALAGDYL